MTLASHSGLGWSPGFGLGQDISVDPVGQVTRPIGSGITTAGGVIALANPLVGGIVAAVGALTGLIGGLFKPDIKKEEATQIVNRIEQEYLLPNLRNWQALQPEQKTPEVQAAALSLFDKAWNGVLQGCSNPQLGQAGVNCISERERGGSAPWCPTGTGCDWFILFRDPIANDPQVAINVANAAAASSAASSADSGQTGSSGASTTNSQGAGNTSGAGISGGSGIPWGLVAGIGLIVVVAGVAFSE